MIDLSNTKHIISVRELLKLCNIPMSEIRKRFENKQIKINGETCTDINLELVFATCLDPEEFAFYIMENFPNNYKLLQLFSFKDIQFSNIENPLVEFLNKCNFLYFSKKEFIVLF